MLAVVRDASPAEKPARRGPGQPAGEGNAQAKLTWENARAIRVSNEKGKVLARRYGISETQVSRIRAGLAWKEASVA